MITTGGTIATAPTPAVFGDLRPAQSLRPGHIDVVDGGQLAAGAVDFKIARYVIGARIKALRGRSASCDPTA